MTALSPFLLGKVKPPRKTKADSLSVCKFHTFHIYQGIYTKAGPFYSQRQHKDTKGFLFTIYELDSSNLANSTRPTRPTLVSRSVHFEHISTLHISNLSARYCAPISDRSGSASRHPPLWSILLDDIADRLAPAFTVKSTRLDSERKSTSFSQVISHHQRTKLNPALDGKHIFLPHLNPFM